MVALGGMRGYVKLGRQIGEVTIWLEACRAHLVTVALSPKCGDISSTLVELPKTSQDFDLSDDATTHAATALIGAMRGLGSSRKINAVRLVLRPNQIRIISFRLESLPRHPSERSRLFQARLSREFSLRLPVSEQRIKIHRSATGYCVTVLIPAAPAHDLARTLSRNLHPTPVTLSIQPAGVSRADPHSLSHALRTLLNRETFEPPRDTFISVVEDGEEADRCSILLLTDKGFPVVARRSGLEGGGEERELGSRVRELIERGQALGLPRPDRLFCSDRYTRKPALERAVAPLNLEVTSLPDWASEAASRQASTWPDLLPHPTDRRSPFDKHPIQNRIAVLTLFLCLLLQLWLTWTAREQTALAQMSQETVKRQLKQRQPSAPTLAPKEAARQAARLKAAKDLLEQSRLVAGDLLTALEATLPKDARLLSIGIRSGGGTLEGRAKMGRAITDFFAALSTAPGFSNVYLKLEQSDEEDDGRRVRSFTIDFDYQGQYPQSGRRGDEGSKTAAALTAPR